MSTSRSGWTGAGGAGEARGHGGDTEGTEQHAAAGTGLSERQAWTLAWQSANLAPLLRAAGRRRAVESYWTRYRNLDAVRAAIGFSDETRVLDVGCGLATVLAALPGVRVGIDHLAREYAALLPPPPGVSIVAGSAEELPFPDASFDVAVCSNALDHFDDPAAALREMRRALRPGGWLVLTCEIAHTPGKGRNAGHPHSLTEGELEGLLECWSIALRWRSPFVGVAAHLRGETTGRHPELGFLARRG